MINIDNNLYAVFTKCMIVLRYLLWLHGNTLDEFAVFNVQSKINCPCVYIIDPFLLLLTVKGAFQLRAFHTHVYARKVNLSKFYASLLITSTNTNYIMYNNKFYTFIL